VQDAPRPRTPAACRVEQWGQSMALACEPPADSWLPIGHRTLHEWADAAIKRSRGETVAKRQGGVVSTHVASNRTAVATGSIGRQTRRPLRQWPR